jgi:DNA repair exonuclease SbcCD ATPase subunit
MGKGGTGASTAGGKTSSGALLRQDHKASQDLQQQEGNEEGSLKGDAGSCHACCCPVCETPFVRGKDQVLINGSQQHMDEVRVQLREEAAAKAQAKQKKRKRAAEAEPLQQQPLRLLALSASS